MSTQKQDEVIKPVNITLKRVAVIDGVRRHRGWQGITAQRLPENCFFVTDHAKKTGKKSNTTGDK